MRHQELFFLALAAAVLTVGGWFATPTVAQAISELQTPASDPATLLLSPPSLRIASLAASGMSDDDLMALIGNFPSSFNLTAQGIICLQGLGVSSAVTLAMLNHDLFLSNNPSAIPPYHWQNRKLNRQSSRRGLCRMQPTRRN